MRMKAGATVMSSGDEEGHTMHGKDKEVTCEDIAKDESAQKVAWEITDVERLLDECVSR